jgi:hypothetical protein
MAERPRPRFLQIRDPLWRQSTAIRVGMPVLAVLLAITIAWLINQA